MARSEITRLCDHCGETFTREKRYPHPHFCSKRCAIHARPTIPQVIRFWPKVQRGNGCWLWTGGTYEYGYGCFFWGHDEVSVNGMRAAHRVAYELTYGPIPNGMKVLHHCDNPPCCRPEHLFLGTDADNSADKIRKQRHAHGTKSPQSKLTDAAVRIIRLESAKGISRASLARRFNVSAHVVFCAANYITWKHLP